MRRITSAFLLGLLVLLSTACSDDNVDALTIDPNSEAYFANGMNFEYEEGSQSLTFTSSQNWRITLSNNGGGWCTVSQASGLPGNPTVKINVTENDGDATRSVTLTLAFTSEEMEKSFTITQKPLSEATFGLSFSPAVPNADQPLTITFRAATDTPLYGHTGDVYAHLGVITEGAWMYVPARWDENIDKCKMTSIGKNVWNLTLSPSVREWFGSGETAVNKLGVLVRNADGTLKGLAEDTFVDATDAKYSAFVPAAIKTGALPAGALSGINMIDNSTVILVLYDKDTNGDHKDFAHVVGDFNNWKLANDETSQMFRDDAEGCWWIKLTGLDATKEYAFQYYVGMKDGETFRLADAYCEKILDPDNDRYIPTTTYTDNLQYPVGAIGIASVFKIQKDNYTWKVANFQRPTNDKMVIYELLLRDFTETGDINGLKAKLTYLQSLGVNAIELMPVQEFDGNDSWGYNPCFFFALDKAYGTKKMYKELIDACHEKGMAVIFDVVYNHATGNNPFARLYWNSADNKTAANNPYFNVDAPHPYSVFHDFNHESPLVKAFVKRNLKFLLDEYKIDGFRFDLTKGFTQNSSTDATAGNYDASRVAILKGYNDAVKATKADAIVILEHFCDLQEETELSNAGMMLWRNLNGAYCNTAAGKSADSGFGALTTKGTSMAANAWVGYMESHDEQRMGYVQTSSGQGLLKTNTTVRMKQLATNAALFFTVSGPKMMWQFGEMGYDVDINYNGRTGRKPLHWDYLDYVSRLNLHDTYAKLLKLRAANPVLFSQDAFKSWNVAASDWDNGRDITLETVDGKKLVVVGNFTDATITRTVTFPSTGTWTNYMDNSTVNVSSTSYGVEIPAHEFRLYVLNVQ